VIVGVGLGWPSDDFDTFREGSDEHPRARLLDEGLDVLARLWTGQEFEYAGSVYRVERERFRPRPFRDRSIPIWVGGGWANPAILRRAPRWHGAVPIKVGEAGLETMTPNESGTSPTGSSGYEGLSTAST
jgi:Luciferase-like monooxygenase